MTRAPRARGVCTTVLFDMFDTIVRFDRSRLPLMEIGGREIRSSVARLFPVAARALPGVNLETFYDAFVWSYREVEQSRGQDHREVPARERLALCYRRLGFDPAGVPPAVTDDLLDLHMECLARCAATLPGLGELFDWLRGRYRLGLVSNFDYSPTVHRVLAAERLLDRFESIVVSDQVGWRKPSPVIFRVAFTRLGVRAEECLFVGDRPELDVAGAKAVGMEVAWLNPAGETLPAGLPAPDFTIGRLAEVRGLLEGRPVDG